MQIFYEDEQACWFDPAGSAGKTSPARSAAAPRPARTSASSWRNSSKFTALPFQSLDLTPGSGNLLGEFYWETHSPWRGGCWTLNTGASPRDAGESTLLSILQDGAPPKYYLTVTACLGILRRTTQRGKTLPPSLKLALELQSGLRSRRPNHELGSPLLFENHGIDSRYTGPHSVAPTITASYGKGGNHGSLVQQEADVYCLIGNAIDRQPKNGGNGLGWQADISYTLTTSDRHALFVRRSIDQLADSSRLPALIRRLTPLECERLQGFPDGWTDIPGASDTVRYVALGNSVAIPCVRFVMNGIRRAAENEQSPA